VPDSMSRGWHTDRGPGELPRSESDMLSRPRDRAWLIHCFPLVALTAGLWLAGSQAEGQSAGTWLEFRGPGGRGEMPESRLPSEWTGDAVLWRQTPPGRGWSSPVIVDNEVWFTAAIEHRPEDSERSPVERLELIAQCLSLDDGRLLHQVALFDVADPVELHPLNSYASPTPVVAGDRVVCSFGDMGTACVRRSDGFVLWKDDHFALDHETGPGSSPVVWRDRVLLNLDGTDRQSVAALDLDSGKVLWETPRSGELHPDGMMKKAFCTPLILEQGGGAVVVSPGANWVYGYDPEDGRELWKTGYGQLGFSNVPRPVLADGLMLVCTGYNVASLLALRPTQDGRGTPELAWRHDRKVPTMPSPIATGGRIFMVSDDGVATALETATGRKLWQQRMGGSFSASPVLAGQVLVFGNRDGEVVLVRPADEYEEIARHQLDGALMATPAPLEDGIVIRTASSICRIVAGPVAQPSSPGGGR
jgi:outer membrane protein assembly factor BamB